MATLELKDLRKSYGETDVLHGIDLAIEDGEFVVLVGPSGCGKSTTLRLIAGLEDASHGEISIAGRVVNNLEPRDRDIAMVFQNYAIYPHMTVKKNIAFGLRTSGLAAPQKEKRIQEVAQILDMKDLLSRKPNELSGGQRQRVAIGRAMVRDPAVFLFDEPLSNLDAQLRTQMRLEIKKLHQRVGNTIVFVTHDQVEAMTMADRIVIMKDGEIQQVGTPNDVYRYPINTFVASFIGAPAMNMIEGTAVSDGVLHLNSGEQVSVKKAKITLDQRVTLGVRPDHLHVSDGSGDSGDSDGGLLFRGKVALREPLGPETLLYIETTCGELVVRASGEHPPEVGTELGFSAAPEHVHVFDSSTGVRLS